MNREKAPVSQGSAPSSGFNGHGGRLTIDLGVLAENYHALANKAGGAECAAAIKGDAYGHGLEPVSKALWAAGCRTFCVAHLSEAKRIRDQLGSEPKIYILNGLLPGLAPQMAALDATPVLSSLDEIAEWKAYCLSDAGKAADCKTAFMIDTGFNRLGLSQADLETIAHDEDILQGMKISWVMSHFACADTPGHPLNADQMRRFDQARQLFPEAAFSLANSGAFLGNDASRFDMVRIGLSLYGGAALTGGPNPLRPVARLDVPVLQCRNVKAGETIGYGATYKVDKPTRVALLSVGYADGFMRALSGHNNEPGGLVYFAGQAAPVIGRVSMDIISVDVSHLPRDLADRGSWAEVIGPHQSASTLAKAADTIDYEVFTSFGSRYERIYLGTPDS